jgi:hypothetical protein
MDRLEVTYLEIDAERRRDELVNAAFDILFEIVLRDLRISSHGAKDDALV